ncbi:phosphotransferase system, mannose fructose-specific component IIA [Loigolactobacillus rennini DSM 20253]|uniref:Phosphotransferase system, mannose fructose-specific component IIA n=2 Tax=Loigolactobacillus rennini TaxID=238013 RepID=A0A0R2DI32_9LACO|nr:phosphotransferase system, mannose fructose-specific component IIA [Loigolactobacillus rennini DSM 20253]
MEEYIMANFTTIVTGHGSFATGIKNTLNLLSVIPDNYKFVNFENGMTEAAYKKELDKVMDKDEQILFFTDIYGGTPFKVCADLAYHNDKIEVVTGCNIGSLMEATYNTYRSLSNYADDLIVISKNFTQRLSAEKAGR